MIYISKNLFKSHQKAQIAEFENLLKHLPIEEQNILKNNVLNPIAFLLISEIKKKDRDVKLIKECLSYLLLNAVDSNQLTLQNNQLYLPPSDTRGENLNYTVISDSKKVIFFKNLARAKELLGKDWEELISIVNVVTFVTITGKEELLTHFSGSNSDLWGAIHMNNNLDLINIIECLTHEASHHWLNLLEFSQKEELIKNGWDDNKFISPWRRDRRPLMGLLHGVYVFGNVFIIYFRLKAILSQYDSDRMYYIGNQVRRGYEIIEENSFLLIQPTLDFLAKSLKDFLAAFNQLDSNNKEVFYQKVLSQEEEKARNFS
jgi:hypothetical protein